MTTTVGPCICAGCGQVIENTDSPRVPYPNCGATARKWSVEATATVTGSAGLVAKAYSETKRPKKPGQSRKPFFEERQIDELYKKDGETYRVLRIIDYVKDWYHKKITSKKTGAVVYEVFESLRKDHQGHGSAKKKT